MKTQRTKLRRKPLRGSHDRETIEAILDEAIACHVGVTDEGIPVVTPTLHVRVGDRVYLHGSSASRTLRAAEGSEVCLTVSLIDGLVLARSAMHHSANYRSAMVFGRAEKLDEGEEKLAALEALIEKLTPGRWREVRKPTGKELRAASVLRLPIDEASAKVRSGPPVDDDADLSLRVWAGVLPLSSSFSEPLPDEICRREQVPLPGYLRGAEGGCSPSW